MNDILDTFVKISETNMIEACSKGWKEQYSDQHLFFSLVLTKFYLGRGVGHSKTAKEFVFCNADAFYVASTPGQLKMQGLLPHAQGVMEENIKYRSLHCGFKNMRWNGFLKPNGNIFIFDSCTDEQISEFMFRNNDLFDCVKAAVSVQTLS